MKKITCKKPCNIGGERFAIGDDVPVKLIAPDREAVLVKYGLISVKNVPEAPSVPVSTDTPDGGEKKSGEKVKK